MHGSKKNKREDFRRQFIDPVEQRLNKQHRRQLLDKANRRREEELYEDDESVFVS